jgi:transposase
MNAGVYSTSEIRIRAVEALVSGVSVTDVALAYRVDRTTLFRWRQRYELEGESGLQRRGGSGRPRKLSELAEDVCSDIVLQPASAFGFETDLWTVRRVHQVLCTEYNAAISRDTIWRRLREAGLTYQKPERQYFQIDEKARQEWLRKEVPKIRRMVGKHRAILYFQDESNISLTALLGKTWAPCGETPTIHVTGKRGGVSAMSAISGRGHLLFRLLDKRIASAEVIDFLRQMLKHHPRRHLVVAMDQAPPHTSKITRAFIESQPRLHVFYLPKYSPDWNPDEKVWNHLKHQELVAHQARTKDELRTLTHRKLKHMSQNPSLIRGIFFRCCVADFFR